MEQIKAELIDRLKSAGLENINLQHSKATRKTIVAMYGTSRPNRNILMKEFVNSFGYGSFVNKGGGGEADLDSIDFKNSSFQGYKVLFKPSQEKNLTTAEHETMSAYFTIEKFNNPNTKYTFQDFRYNSRLQINKSITLEMLLEKTNKLWLNSCTLHAEALYNFVKRRHKDYIICHPNKRKSPFYNSLYDSAKFLFKKMNMQSMSLDKWNPGDIWIVHQSMIGHNFKQYKDITALNSFLLDQFEKQNIIGVSLKQVFRQPIMQVFNDSNQRPLEVKFSKIFTPSDFLTTNKGVIVYNNTKKMDFRSFDTSSNSNIQGEIQGVTAQGGKIGHGGLLTVFGPMTHRDQLIRTFNLNKDKAAIASAIFEKFERLKQRFRLNTKYTNAFDYVDFIKKSKDIKSGWLISKYQVIELFENLNRARSNQEISNMLQDAVAYAASQTDVSSVFVKVFN